MPDFLDLNDGDWGGREEPALLLRTYPTGRRHDPRGPVLSGWSRENPGESVLPGGAAEALPTVEQPHGGPSSKVARTYIHQAMRRPAATGDAPPDRWLGTHTTAREEEEGLYGM